MRHSLLFAANGLAVKSRSPELAFAYIEAKNDRPIYNEFEQYHQ